MIHHKKAPLQSKAVEPLLQIFLLLIRPVIRRMPSALSRPASSESLLNSPVSKYARVRAPLAVRCKGICCHRKNRNIIVLTHTVSNFFRRLDAIHHRHLHIHEDRKIASRIRRFKLIHGLGTILRPVHDKAEASEQLRRNLCIQCIILRKQNSSTPAISATRYSGWSNRYAMMVGVSTFMLVNAVIAGWRENANSSSRSAVRFRPACDSSRRRKTPLCNPASRSAAVHPPEPDIPTVSEKEYHKPLLKFVFSYCSSSRIFFSQAIKKHHRFSYRAFQSFLPIYFIRNVPYLRSWLPFYRPCSFASQPFDCFAEILFLF